jgi:hypothetical protein
MILRGYLEIEPMYDDGFCESIVILRTEGGFYCIRTCNCSFALDRYLLDSEAMFDEIISRAENYGEVVLEFPERRIKGATC